jgi:hypothetical protein
MLDLDGELRLNDVQKSVSTKTEFFEIDSWRLVGCTPSLHDYVV